MKFQQISAITCTLFVLAVLVGCSRVVENPESLNNSMETNVAVSDGDWQLVRFSLGGFSYTLKVPHDWQTDYQVTDPDFFTNHVPIDQPVQITGISSPRYDEELNVLPKYESRGLFISVEIGLYKNTDSFKEWYEINHKMLTNLHSSTEPVVENTITVDGINGKSISVHSISITDSAGTYPAMQSTDLFIPVNEAVLNIYIGGEPRLMDHFVDTVDEIIDSISI